MADIKRLTDTYLQSEQGRDIDTVKHVSGTLSKNTDTADKWTVEDSSKKTIIVDEHIIVNCYSTKHYSGPIQKFDLHKYNNNEQDHLKSLTTNDKAQLKTRHICSIEPTYKYYPYYITHLQE
jgi:hypothetical protein